jgi:hypothetical protein
VEFVNLSSLFYCITQFDPFFHTSRAIFLVTVAGLKYTSFQASLINMTFTFSHYLEDASGEITLSRRLILTFSLLLTVSAEPTLVELS